jgi:pimeloyl-ACP methyl ester carboxylesterase
MPFGERDGVKLFYEDRGGDGVPLLFIHGWCCDHTYFAPQAEHFAARGHRVVSVDLRGHGQSDKPEQEYTMPAFAADVAWLCGELELERPVVAGHSMGGVVALALAAVHPEVPRAIALFDSPIAVPGAVIASLGSFLEALRSSACSDVAAAFVSERLFIATDDPERRRQIVQAMTCAPQHVMASAMENIFSYDSEAALAATTVPLLYVAADRFIADANRIRELRPDAVIAQTCGAGHFHQLEVPGQVNAMLERFLAVLPAVAGSVSG